MPNYKKLVSAGFVALGIILLPLLVLPQYNLIAVTKKAVISRQTGLEKKKALMEKIESLKKQTQEKRGEMDKLAMILPQTKKVQEIVVNLEEMSKQTGVQIKTIKTAQVSSAKSRNARVLQIEINSSGQYKALADFIKLIEKNLRVLDVQEFTLSLDTSATAAGGLNFAVKMHGYYIE